MALVNKNQRAGQRGRVDYRGQHEGDMLNTLPKYNYSSGAGWKTASCKGGSRRLSFEIKRKKRGRSY
jgi:hypothetical protein